jgi:hypothetical protein
MFAIDAMGGLPNSAMLTFKTSQLPITFGLGMLLNQDVFNMGLTLDWWLWHQHLVGILDLYAGPGLYVIVPETFELGGRIPVGLQIWPLGTQLLELFVELAPGIRIISSESGVQIPAFLLQAGFGFRFWF